MIATLIALFLLALGFCIGILWADHNAEKRDRLPDDVIDKLRTGRWN